MPRQAIDCGASLHFSDRHSALKGLLTMHKNITDVIVIGAGPAGLAVGGCLKRAGVSFLILDSASTVGSRWTEHYDRLHLHTAKQIGRAHV